MTVFDSIVSDPLSALHWQHLLSSEAVAFANPLRGGKYHNLSSKLKHGGMNSFEACPLRFRFFCPAGKPGPWKEVEANRAVAAAIAAKLKDGNIASRILCSDDELVQINETTM